MDRGIHFAELNFLTKLCAHPRDRVVLMHEREIRQEIEKREGRLRYAGQTSDRAPAPPLPAPRAGWRPQRGVRESDHAARTVGRARKDLENTGTRAQEHKE
jgi:hypothetical protein